MGEKENSIDIEIFSEIGSSMKSQFKEAGLYTLKDLVMLGALDLSKVTGLDPNTCAQICRKARIRLQGLGIVILDEVQSIDYKHWMLIHDCLEFLANELDVRIILMTATQPLIFKEDEALELFDIKQSFPERVRFDIDLNGISILEFFY